MPVVAAAVTATVADAVRAVVAAWEVVVVAAD